MDYVKQSNDLKELRRRNRSLGVTLGGTVLGLLLALVIILDLIGAERTIVTPPAIDKTFWVSRDAVSASYLEQMAGFMAWLILDAAPASIEWKKKVLLDYVAPDQQGEFQKRQDFEADRLRHMNATTSFLPQQFVTDEKTQSVVIHGRLSTRVNGTETGNELKHYFVQFHYAGGRMHLAAFKEVEK